MIGELAARSQPIETVSEATFEALVLQADGPTVVEFMSYGCSHCRALEPVLAQVSRSVAAWERILRVNVALEQGLTDRYAIAVTPTLVMFLDGREVGRVAGPRPHVASLLTALTQPFDERPR